MSEYLLQSGPQIPPSDCFLVMMGNNNVRYIIENLASSSEVLQALVGDLSVLVGTQVSRLMELGYALDAPCPGGSSSVLRLPNPYLSLVPSPHLQVSTVCVGATHWGMSEI